MALGQLGLTVAEFAGLALIPTLPLQASTTAVQATINAAPQKNTPGKHVT